MILSTDGQMDGQTDKVKPVYPPFNFVEAVGIINTSNGWKCDFTLGFLLKRPDYMYQMSG